MKRGPFIGMVALAVMSMSIAASAGEMARDHAIQFDIPAQPLAAALARYGDITGREVFYQVSMVEDRRSNLVAGRLAPPEALVRLLDGTGLRARFLDDGSFVLSLPSVSEVPAIATRSGQAAAQRYYGQIQAAVRESFCRRGLEPGTLRAVALIWIGSGGTIERVQQISSSGMPAIDRNIEAAFLNVRLDERPPAEFAQPALVMMVPQASVAAAGCRHEIGPMRMVRP